MTIIEEDIDVDISEIEDILNTKKLVVFNDDVNSFQFVIETLIKVCEQTPDQAEQCTWIIHHKGKCAVKEGSHDELKPFRNAITERGIKATIE